MSDREHKTVMDCLCGENLKGCAPVGRLDKDTEGLLLITNDGQLSHRLLSPQSHVEKRYFAILDTDCPKEAVVLFKDGVDIGDDKPTLPAKLEITTNPKEVYLTIVEGRFHQVKRMFKAIGCNVIYLKRCRKYTSPSAPFYLTKIIQFDKIHNGLERNCYESSKG